MLNLHISDIWRKGSYLYCSTVTKGILLSNMKYVRLRKFLVSLDLNDPFLVDSADSLSQVVVTLLPAGHCPGSVMFLFEGDNGRVLYTGDFRLPPGAVEKYDCLHHNDSVKHINTIYVDTTFCSPEAKYIPSRKDSQIVINRLVGDWLNQDEQRLVRIICSADIGYENVFVELNKLLKIKVHVNCEKMKTYAVMPEVKDAVTDDCNSRIHACTWQKDGEINDKYSSNLPCRRDKISGPILCIKLSAMWFTQHVSVNDISVKSQRNQYYRRVCYSTHSSLTEIQDFVTYLNPEKIVPTVIPVSTTLSEIYSLLVPNQHKVADEVEQHHNGKLGRLKKRNFGERQRLISDIASTPEKRQSLNNVDVISPLFESDSSSTINKKLMTDGNSCRRAIAAEMKESPVWNYPDSDGDESAIGLTDESKTCDRFSGNQNFLFKASNIGNMFSPTKQNAERELGPEQPSNAAKFENLSPDLFDSNDKLIGDETISRDDSILTESTNCSDELHSSRTTFQNSLDEISNHWKSWNNCEKLPNYSGNHVPLITLSP